MNKKLKLKNTTEIKQIIETFKNDITVVKDDCKKLDSKLLEILSKNFDDKSVLKELLKLSQEFSAIAHRIIFINNTLHGGIYERK